MGALLLVFAAGWLFLRAPLSGRLPVGRALAAAVPLPGGVLPPDILDRTWYVQTDSALYFSGPVSGRFSDVRGSWTVDMEHPDRMRGDVEVGIASVMTGDGARDTLLKSAAWLGDVRYHDLTARLGAVSGWPSVLRRAQAVDFTMDGRVSARGVARDVSWRCGLEPDARQMRMRCTAMVTPADFGLPAAAAGPVQLTAQMHFAGQPG